MSERLVMERLTLLSLVLLAVRLGARAPDAGDPPEMRAFYHTWLQPSWLLVVAPFVVALLLPWVRFFLLLARPAISEDAAHVSEICACGHIRNAHYATRGQCTLCIREGRTCEAFQ